MSRHQAHETPAQSAVASDQGCFVESLRLGPKVAGGEDATLLASVKLENGLQVSTWGEVPLIACRTGGATMKCARRYCVLRKYNSIDHVPPHILCK